VRWDSDGEGQYQIASATEVDRGTEVILHLREDDKEFLEAGRLRQLVRKYSDHLSIPIILKDGDDPGDRQPGQGVLDALEIRVER
jgi:molecular chaperone HtpG